MWRLSAGGPLAGKLRSLTPSSGRVVLGAARLIDCTGADPRRADVVLAGERIEFVGSAGRDRLEGAERVDCDGMTIIPGLIDAHVHYGGELTSDPYRRYLWPDDRVRTLKAALSAFATFEAGFTTVRDVGLTGAGYALRYAINAGWILGPRILTAGPSISSTGGHGDWHALPLELVRERRVRSVIADGVDECRRAVREVHREGADLLKIFVSTGILTTLQDWPPLPAFTLPEIAAMAEEAHMRKMRVACHAKGVESIRLALLGGTDTLEHGTILAGEDPEEVLDLMAQRDVILVPTISVYYNTKTFGRQWGNIEEGIRRAEDQYERAPALVQGAKRRGIRIALGTDISSRAGVGDNAREMKHLADAGLTPMEALQAGTQIAAEALGIDRELGTVEPGKLADLLILDIDPLSDFDMLVGPAHICTIFKASETISTRWRD